MKSTSASKITLVTVVATLASLTAMVAQEDAPPDPRPGATQPTREQNLDMSGWIAVHEQGTAKVDVTNEELAVSITNSQLEVSGTVSVDNFPAEQDVNVTGGSIDANITGGAVDANVMFSPVTMAFQHGLSVEAGALATIPFATMNVTTIVIQSDDEKSASLFSPLSAQPLFRFSDDDGDIGFFSESFTHPIPMNGIRLSCRNESDDCFFNIGVVGF